MNFLLIVAVVLHYRNVYYPFSLYFFMAPVDEIIALIKEQAFLGNPRGYMEISRRDELNYYLSRNQNSSTVRQHLAPDWITNPCGPDLHYAFARAAEKFPSSLFLAGIATGLVSLLDHCS